jgi:hypothetical protein
MTTTLTSTIREWVAAGCGPTTLYQDEDSRYYTSAHPGGLGGHHVTELTDDNWGEFTPTTTEDADWIVGQLVSTSNLEHSKDYVYAKEQVTS